MGLVLPAYAGMIRSSTTSHRATRCAPRVCGDDPAARVPVSVTPVVLPAYAGMIPIGRPGAGPRRGAPRVCGDDPACFEYESSTGECSPRMRG